MPVPAVSQVLPAAKDGSTVKVVGQPPSLSSRPNIVMRLNRTWNVKCPPAKKHMVHGQLIPTAKGIFSLGGRIHLRTKQRRLAIEIHGPETNNDDNNNATTTMDNNNPNDRKGENNNAPPPNLRGQFKRETQTVSQAIQLSKELKDDDKIVVRILKPRKMWGFSRDHDDSSDSDSDSDNNDDKDNDDKDNDDKDNDNDHQEQEDAWVEYRKYGVDEIVDEELTGRHNSTFEATMGLGANRERREIDFENDEQANQFWTELTQLKALVKERAKSRLEEFQKVQKETEQVIQETSKALPDNTTSLSKNMTPQSEINLLIEIVSATDLPIADRLKQSTDPYIIVYLGHEEIHRTSVIPHDLNPIWTIDTGCLCLLSTSAQEFFQASAGLTFILKDKDGLSSNDMLASTSIPQSTLLQLTGEERVALPWNVLSAHKYSSSAVKMTADGSSKVVFTPTLYIRARKATKEDGDFMKKVFAVQKRKSLGVYANQAFVGPHPYRVKLLKRESKMVDGIRKYRVKPHPDPDRPEQETKWMSSDDLVTAAMKASHKWIETGTGSLGKLYLEVLKCDGLPNMDTKMDKTDAFTCIIYEDSIVNTDVINDTLKPRWMPWSQRAFLFRMAHPSSQILIGVFDYDSGSNAAINSHDAIGRINIDITNFRRDTDYVLTYDLYRSVLDNERPKYGTLTVRLRLEYDSYRDFIKGSLDLPPINYINLPQKAGFKTSYFVIHGEENLQRFDMEAITNYRTELEEYLIILHYMKRAAITVLLWRGHKEIKIGKYKVSLPLHSAVAFWMGITLIDNFNLFPSYFLFSIAWLLLATNELRQEHPSPWHSSLTYLQLWHAVFKNEAPPVIIDAYEDEAIIRAYEKDMKEEKEKQMARAEKAREQAERIDALFSEERNSAAEAFEEDMTTKKGGLPSLNPLARVLLPIQQILGNICKALRITSSIVRWDESIYAFIIVNACLLLGFVLLWFPWSFVIRWTIRIAIWVFLGPWMKLFDIYYVQMQMAEGEDETTMFRKKLQERLQSYNVTREATMRAKEGILKHRALKRFMFGKFVARVPQLKEYRYPDVPRAESFAKPVQSPPAVTIERRSHGQTLVGKMVPTWGDAVDAMKLEEKKKTKEAAQKAEEKEAKKDDTKNSMKEAAANVDENESKKDA